MKKTTLPEFIEKASKIHGKFDYSKAVYLGSQEKLEIVCQEHGSFWQTPDKHTNGVRPRGCPSCSGLQRLSTAEFERRCQEMYPDGRYSYCDTDYVNAKTSVTVKCKKHGNFTVLAFDHMKGRLGCQKCSTSGYSKHKPGWLYVLKFENFVKVGITNRSPRERIMEVSRSSGKKFQCVFQMKFEDGAQALRIETALLKDLKESFKNPVEIYDGSTEVFDGPNVNNIIGSIHTLLILPH